MALATLNFAINASNSWTKVADDPTYVSIRIRDSRPWELCVTPSGAPSVAGTQATGTVTFGGQPTAAQTTTIGGVVYTYQAALGARDARVMPTITGTRDNLLTAIQADADVTAVASGTDAIAIGPETASADLDTASAAIETAWSAIIAFSGLPTATDTLTVGTTTFEFVAGTPGVDEIEIGADADETAANTLAAIQADGQVSASYADTNEILLKPLTGDLGSAVPISEAADNTTVAWSATITLIAQPADNATIDAGAETYTFQVVAAGDVPLGADAEGTRNSLLLALIGNPAVTAAASSTNIVALTATAIGTAGNSVVLTNTGTNVTVSGAGTLTGGVDASAYMSFNPDNQEDGWHFTKETSSTGEFYVRIPLSQAKGMTDPVQFGVIRDQA